MAYRKFSFIKRFIHSKTCHMRTRHNVDTHVYMDKILCTDLTDAHTSIEVFHT